MGRRRIAHGALAVAVFLRAIGAAGAAASPSSDHVAGVTAIAEVFGDGEKVIAAAVEYDAALANASLSASAFAVAGRTITKVYANTEPARLAPAQAGFGQAPKVGVDGRYAIVELSPADPAASTIEVVGQGPSATSRKRSVTLSVRQAGSIATAAGASYAPSPTAHSSAKVADPLVEAFQRFVFEDPKFPAERLMYNLFLPKDYDKDRKYPLVLFMPDATGTSEDPDITLVQGLGAVVWASPAEQAKRECIVLAPQYSPKNDREKKVEITYDLVNYIADRYGADRNRLYTTGQSAGCIASIALDIAYPGLFAASFLVAGQYEPAECGPLAKQNIWILVAEGDIQAFPGMNGIAATLERNGATVNRALWDGNAGSSEFAFDVAKMVAEGGNVKYAVFQRGTVVASGLPDDPPHNHMGTWAKAYSIEGIRDWLFSQVKAGLSGKELFDLAVAAGRSGDDPSAFLYFSKALQAGYDGAYERLADCYQSGRGTVVDYYKAAEFGRKAVELGGARACTNLGILYMNGQGVPRDYAVALDLFLRATKAGDFKGPRYAGILYYKGLVGGAPDYGAAAGYFATAAQGGDVTANYYLGLMYEKGQSFAQDYAKAAGYYAKAAPMAGHAEAAALVALGRLYESGLGLRKDLSAAVEQYKRAAALGDADAKAALARLKAD